MTGYEPISDSLNEWNDRMLAESDQLADAPVRPSDTLPRLMRLLVARGWKEHAAASVVDALRAGSMRPSNARIYRRAIRAAFAARHERTRVFYADHRPPHTPAV